VPGVDLSSVDFRKDPVLSRAELAKVVGLDVDVSRAIARELDRPLLVVPIN
jgi:ABC-type amino acid transport substrate-binding protein